MTRTKQNWIVYSQVLLACVIFLTGCTARELEERRFPLALEVDAKDDGLIFTCGWSYIAGGTEEEADKSSLDEKELLEDVDREWEVDNDKITMVYGACVEEALQRVQNLQDKYVDYSQVKAVLLGKTLRDNETLLQEVFRWLEQTPEIARNILIFEADDLKLEEIQKRSQGQPGAYLENLYKNNEKYRDKAGTLKEVLYRDSSKGTVAKYR